MAGTENAPEAAETVWEKFSEVSVTGAPLQPRVW
jgi:hypothetical protein